MAPIFCYQWALGPLLFRSWTEHCADLKAYKTGNVDCKPVLCGPRYTFFTSAAITRLTEYRTSLLRNSDSFLANIFSNFLALVLIRLSDSFDRNVSETFSAHFYLAVNCLLSAGLYLLGTILLC